LLPAMLRLPMAELTPALPLRVEIRKALEGAATPERSLLAWLEFHERGDWAGCDGVDQGYGLNQDGLMKCYAQAMVWAEDALEVCLMSRAVSMQFAAFVRKIRSQDSVKVDVSREPADMQFPIASLRARFWLRSPRRPPLRMTIQPKQMAYPFCR